MEEIWKPIEQTNGHYEISNIGRVRSVSRNLVRCDGKNFRRSGKMFSLQIDRYGYPYVQIRVGGKQKFHFVHRLVALHFLGHSDTLEVNHIDLNKTNNNVENLEWCTRVENLEHAKLNGRRKIGLPRLTMAIADDLRNDRRSGMTYKSLGLKYGVDASLACRIVKGERWAK